MAKITKTLKMIKNAQKIKQKRPKHDTICHTLQQKQKMTKRPKIEQK